jgi:hypothetical protein
MRSKGVELILLVAMCWLLFWPLRADATLVTIEIEAVVDYVTDPHNFFEGKVDVGDTITGWYIYDSSTPDSNPSPYVGDYQHHTPPYGFFLSVGGFDFGTDPTDVDFVIEIINDYTSGGLHDGYILGSYNNVPLPNGTSVGQIFWSLRDESAKALSSIDLPTGPPVLNDWQFNDLRIGLSRASEIRGHVTSAIPEPASILLFGVGCLLFRKHK